MIIQIGNALNHDVCKRLVSYAERSLLSETESARSQSVRPDGWCGDIVDGLAQTCVDHAKSIFQMNMMPTSRGISRYCPGAGMPPHADNCSLYSDGTWVQNKLSRFIAAFYYLSEDFKGGELSFEQLGVHITPRVGLLVMWPGDPDHLHEVRKVSCGYRYALGIALRERPA